MPTATATMSKLPPKQRELFEAMVKHNCNVTEAAEHLGVTTSATYARYNLVKRKYGTEGILEEYPTLRGILPGTKKVAITTAAAVNARSTAQAQARDIVPIDPADLLPASQERLCLALSYLDKYRLSTAKPNELNQTIKNLFEITQVLQGKPTSITSSNNKQSLEKLLPAILNEAKRRGIMFDSSSVIEGEVISSQVQASSVPTDQAREDEVRGAEPLATEGEAAHPPGASGAGPIQPQELSDFSKIAKSLESK